MARDLVVESGGVTCISVPLSAAFEYGFVRTMADSIAFGGSRLVDKRESECRIWKWYRYGNTIEPTLIGKDPIKQEMVERN